MGTKKSTPKPKTKGGKPAPTSPKKPKGVTYRIALAFMLLCTAPVACDGDGGGEAKEASLCVGLAAAAAYHLGSELDCGLEDASQATDFAVACFLGSPTEQEAVECLRALYALTECPEELPAECAEFANLGVVDAIDPEWTCAPCDPPPGPNVEAGPGDVDSEDEEEASLEFGQDNWPIYTFPGDPGPAPDVEPDTVPCPNNFGVCNQVEPDSQDFMDQVVDVFDWQNQATTACLTKGQPCYNPTTGRGGECCGQLQCLSGIRGTVVHFCCGCVVNGACLAVGHPSCL